MRLTLILYKLQHAERQKIHTHIFKTLYLLAIIFLWFYCVIIIYLDYYYSRCNPIYLVHFVFNFLFFRINFFSLRTFYINIILLRYSNYFFSEYNRFLFFFLSFSLIFALLLSDLLIYYVCAAYISCRNSNLLHTTRLFVRAARCSFQYRENRPQKGI